MGSSKYDHRYLELAKFFSTWSKDPSTQIGAVAIGEKGQVLSQGYNGFPRGIKDTPSRLKDREKKYNLVVHAEMNAIYNAGLNGVSLKGSTLYVYGLPVCNECAKGIIQVGIDKVIATRPADYNKKWDDSIKDAKALFKEAEVDYIIDVEK